MVCGLRRFPSLQASTIANTDIIENRKKKWSQFFNLVIHSQLEISNSYDQVLLPNGSPKPDVCFSVPFPPPPPSKTRALQNKMMMTWRKLPLAHHRDHTTHTHTQAQKESVEKRIIRSWKTLFVRAVWMIPRWNWLRPDCDCWHSYRRQPKKKFTSRDPLNYDNGSMQ